MIWAFNLPFSFYFFLTSFVSLVSSEIHVCIYKVNEICICMHTYIHAHIGFTSASNGNGKSGNSEADNNDVHIC